MATIFFEPVYACHFICNIFSRKQHRINRVAKFEMQEKEIFLSIVTFSSNLNLNPGLPYNYQLLAEEEWKVFKARKIHFLENNIVFYLNAVVMEVLGEISIIDSGIE